MNSTIDGIKNSLDTAYKKGKEIIHDVKENGQQIVEKMGIAGKEIITNAKGSCEVIWEKIKNGLDSTKEFGRKIIYLFIIFS